MKYLNKIRKEAKILLMLFMAFSAIAFVNKKQEDKVCQEIRIVINDNGANYFLDKEEIYSIVTANQTEIPIGSPYKRINLKEIEKRVSSNEYVADAQAYADLRGHVMVDVTLNTPIARFLIDGDTDKYICDNGEVISTSSKYTSRVLLLNGDFFKDLTNKNIKYDSTYTAYYHLMKYIYSDKFWKAQIVQMDINQDGDILMYPQVTKQCIEFGKPENIDRKFLKLKVFYKKILPYKGWNSYKRVNIKYKDQIICE